MNDVICIECDGRISLTGNVLVGEIIECPECGMELEVTSLDPVTLEPAPEVEEDWGE